MIWDILVAKLVTEGLGVPGQSLFLHEMPADCPVGMMFKSPLIGIKLDPYMPEYHRPTLQLIVRHTDPVEGEKLALRAANALKVGATERFPANAERGAVEIKQFFARELPIRFPRQDSNTFEWSINFQTAFTLQPL